MVAPKRAVREGELWPCGGGKLEAPSGSSGADADTVGVGSVNSRRVSGRGGPFGIDFAVEDIPVSRGEAAC